MRFPGDGEYTFPDGLATVAIDRGQDRGSYWEPNVWIVHDLRWYCSHVWKPTRGPVSDGVAGEAVVVRVVVPDLVCGSRREIGVRDRDRVDVLAPDAGDRGRGARRRSRRCAARARRWRVCLPQSAPMSRSAAPPPSWVPADAADAAGVVGALRDAEVARRHRGGATAARSIAAVRTIDGVAVVGRPRAGRDDRGSARSACRAGAAATSGPAGRWRRGPSSRGGAATRRRPTSSGCRTCRRCRTAAAQEVLAEQLALDAA